MTTPTTVQVRLQIRADTAANWTSVNPILLTNELGLESDTKKFKIGNGTSAWVDLAYFPSIVSGGTVLGNLEIGTTGTLTFEGSTANGFETTLGVVDPTADRTILLPNQSGTVVVGGNASITDADIAANAEIAVSKLADGAARQLLQTDAAGTGVEWTSNIDIPGTLDVTGAATFDGAVTVAGDLTVNGTTTTISTQNLLVEDKNIILGDVAAPTDVTADGGGITLKGATDKTINWIDATDAWTSSERFSVPLGSAAAPSLTFTSDENTGIYSPGADQVAISTNSVGRIHIGSTGTVNIVGAGTAGVTQAVSFNGSAPVNSMVLDSSGRLGVGTSSPSELLTINSNGTTGTAVRLENTSAGGYNWGIYSVGSAASLGPVGSLAFRDSTNGATRLVIDSSGRVGIGTSSPNTKLSVIGTTGAFADASIRINGTAGTQSNNSGLWITGNQTTSHHNWLIGSQYNVNNAFEITPSTAIDGATFSTPAVVVTSAGRVGVGTTSPGGLLHVSGGRTLLSSSDGYELAFARTGNYFYWYNDGGNLSGKLSLTTSAGAGGGEIITFTQDTKRVGIGTTPAQHLHSYCSTGSSIAGSFETNQSEAYITLRASGTSSLTSCRIGVAGESIVFLNNGANERARLTASGQLLVGTSSTSADTRAIIQGRSSAGDSTGRLHISSGNNTPGDGDGIAELYFTSSGHVASGRIAAQRDGGTWTAGSSLPTRLVFSTTADGASSPTERMRLINSGFLKVSNDGSYQSATSGNHEFTNTLDSDSLVVRSTNASYSGNGILALATRNTTNNSFYAFSYYNSGASAYRFRIADSGNATNTNNSYGAISDIKLKENIVNATSQWDDIKALQVRKYNFKEETGQQTHTQIGLIAQEVELVSPGLVSESPDRDAEGNDLGTVTKSVNYSVLYMKAVKALQEAMERIETLEAKVAALESA